MSGNRIRRSLALVASAALLASLTVATVAAPASAAKQKVVCRGEVATIVGTNKADRLVGTNKRDVIAGLGGNDVIIGAGGNDLICGGTGKDRLVGKGGRDRLYGNGGADTLVGGRGADRLFGGVGNDLLSGQASNDLLGGGPGTDTCYQGTGSGTEVSCELPAAPVAPPAPPALPPADTDGDGVTDDVDACPNKGDQGYGVDATGCPNIPDLCAYLNDPSLDLSYISHGPVKLRFAADQQATWSVAADGSTFNWARTNVVNDDGTPQGDVHLADVATLLVFAATKPGTADFSWETASGEAAAWNVTCRDLS